MRARPAVFVILIWVVLSGSAAGTEAHAADGSVAPTVLADLAPEVIAELEKVEPDSGFPSDPGQQLQRVFEASPAYRFADAGVVVYTDRRWYSTTSVVGPRAPLLELRRWPGDSVLAVYAVRRSDGAGPGGEGPPIEKGSFVPAPGFVPGGAAWQGTVETPQGSAPRSGSRVRRSIRPTPGWACCCYPVMQGSVRRAWPASPRSCAPWWGGSTCGRRTGAGTWESRPARASNCRR